MALGAGAGLLGGMALGGVGRLVSSFVSTYCEISAVGLIFLGPRLVCYFSGHQMMGDDDVTNNYYGDDGGDMGGGDDFGGGDFGGE